MWDDANYAAFDFETSGVKQEYALQPWRPLHVAWPTSLAWVWRDQGQQQVGGDLFPDHKMVDEMLTWALDEKRTLVGWHTVFDVAWLYATGTEKLVNQSKFMDGMLLWRHLDIEPEYEATGPSRKSYSLKNAVREFLPQYANYEEGIDFASDDLADLQELHDYNVRDCSFTLRLARKFWLALKTRQRRAATIEARSLNMVAQSLIVGMMVDPLEVSQLSQWLKDTAKVKLASLAPYGVTEKIVRSPTQLSKLMFDDWKLPILKENESKKTGKVSRSTDKNVLHELAFLDPRAKELREYREALNNDTKFAEAPRRATVYNEDGKAHPFPHVFGTYSGRMTYSSKQGKNKNERQIGFALHQEKRGKEFRRIIVAPPGYAIMEFDAAGQEFRWMAIASGDLTMLQLCRPGEDPHSYMGAKIAHTDYKVLMTLVKALDKAAENIRKSGKVANLCCIAYTPVLTDRGHVAIQDVRRDDLVWDGIEFVAHDGVVFSGVREVITHDGVTATPEHKVMVGGRWVELRIAKRDNQAIDRTTRYTGSAVWIVGGVVKRHYRAGWRAICAGALRLWCGARSHSSLHEDRQIDAMQRLRDASPAQNEGPLRSSQSSKSDAYKTYRGMASAVRKRARQIISKLWGPGDQIQVCVDQTCARLHSDEFTSHNLQGGGHRSQGQRWALRAGQPPVGHTQGEPAEQAWFQHGYVEGGIDPDAKLGRKPILVDLYDALCGARAFWRSYPAPRPRSGSGEAQGVAKDRSQAPVYDIVNCGPRSRFSVSGRIVHNSLQYRTSPPKLCQTARVDYNMPMTLDEAKVISRVYRNTYQGVPQYWINQITRVQALGFAETFAGRRVKVVGEWRGRNGWSMGSTAINFRIQGTGADQKYLAMMCIEDTVRDVGGYFAWDLHDGIYLYIPVDRVEEAAIKIKDILDNLPYGSAWGFHPPIPMPWDCKVGPSWGDLKEFKFN